MNPMKIFLVDNGSLRPKAVFALRKLADKLSENAGYDVEATSVLHSHKIAADKLDGEAATIFEQRLNACIDEGINHFIVIPCFLGPSRAFTEYLPSKVDAVSAENPDIFVQFADPLAGANPNTPDIRLAQILVDHAKEIMKQHALAPSNTTIAVVDHGTPFKPVNHVRNAVAEQVSSLINASAHALFTEEGSNVIACSMERREGKEYDFNEPLLENIHKQPSVVKNVIAAMFFLLPGRHAGPGGDVASICDALCTDTDIDNVYVTKLLSEHPLLADILRDRLFDVVNKEEKE